MKNYFTVKSCPQLFGCLKPTCLSSIGDCSIQAVSKLYVAISMHHFDQLRGELWGVYSVIACFLDGTSCTNFECHVNTSGMVKVIYFRLYYCDCTRIKPVVILQK